MWRICQVGMFVVVLGAIFAYHQTIKSPEMSEMSQTGLSTVTVNASTEEVLTPSVSPAEQIERSVVDDRLEALGFQPKEKIHSLSVRPGGGSARN